MSLLFHRDSSPFFFYKILLALSFSIFLGACGGGARSAPSSDNSSSHEPKECEVENGKGEQNWNASLKDWNDKCELIACNAGYDDSDDNHACEETPAGHYSEDNSKKRTACTDNPDGSSWTDATGLASAEECAWACDTAGYDNQENSKLCEPTIAGYYSEVNSNDRRRVYRQA